ncbi:MAG: hypothetical protein B7Y83_05945 [Flavobacteriales bacterium 32-34-25]|nr:MAG: hypothetical protein B7Y83_05945 [Flavobacteriales bacterium 32-34-25]
MIGLAFLNRYKILKVIVIKKNLQHYLLFSKHNHNNFLNNTSTRKKLINPIRGKISTNKKSPRTKSRAFTIRYNKKKKKPPRFGVVFNIISL